MLYKNQQDSEEVAMVKAEQDSNPIRHPKEERDSRWIFKLAFLLAMTGHGFDCPELYIIWTVFFVQKNAPPLI